MKIIPNKRFITSGQFEEYLKSISGLKSSYTGNIIERNLCECSDGWLYMIKNLIKELIELGWDKQISQIKEKFGTLRFYTGETTKQMNELITKYENLSAETCEICGDTNTAKMRSGGWIRTLCDKCEEKRKKLT